LLLQVSYRYCCEEVNACCGAELALTEMREESERVSGLRDRLERGLQERVPHSWVNGARAPRVPNTSNLTFPFIEGETMVIALDLKGIACSTGAVCSSGAVEPSHVLLALGLAPEDARTT
jgi:cysteine desulfurase